MPIWYVAIQKETSGIEVFDTRCLYGHRYIWYVRITLSL